MLRQRSAKKMRRYFTADQGKYEQITEQQNGWAERSKILLFFHFLGLSLFNSLLPVIDQNRISPYNINTSSRTQKLRIKKYILIRGLLVDRIPNPPN